MEIAFLDAHGVGARTLAWARDLAMRQGVGPEEALLAEGVISEKAFYRALADRLGVPYYNGDPALRACPDVNAAILSGFASLDANGHGARVVVAPRGAALRFLLEAPEASREGLPIAIASRQRLSAILRARFGADIARQAADALAERDATLSARGGVTLAQLAALFVVLGSVAFAANLAPTALRVALSLGFWAMFSAAVWLRSIAVAARDTSRLAARLNEAELPVVTIISALHREAAVAADLVSALDALDYPRAKLDIKLVVEQDDPETLPALVALRLPAHYDIIVAPRGRPTTKPRALNIALGVARGSLLVVYDAEDRPAKDQIRLAAERFAADPSLDCLQARLAIDNGGDSWLTKMFAVEYAMLFDLINPGLAALRLPIALGGTSNFFRTCALREAGAWDAWNVTEDADLGIRLARKGMRIETLASDTLEEAPHEWRNWFRQRVRWQKGWMQTLIVHLRRPRRVLKELGAWRGLAAFALIGGAVAGGLFGALFMIETLARLIVNVMLPGYLRLWYGDIITIGLFLWGVQSVAVPAILVMRRRRMPGIAPRYIDHAVLFPGDRVRELGGAFRTDFPPLPLGQDRPRASQAARGAVAAASVGGRAEAGFLPGCAPGYSGAPGCMAS